MPDEVREHLTRDQRPFLHPESLQIFRFTASPLQFTHLLQGSDQRTHDTRSETIPSSRITPDLQIHSFFSSVHLTHLLQGSDQRTPDPRSETIPSSRITPDLQIHSFFSSVHLTHLLQGSGQRTPDTRSETIPSSRITPDLQIHSFFSSVHLTHLLQGSGQRTPDTRSEINPSSRITPDLQIHSFFSSVHSSSTGFRSENTWHEIRDHSFIQNHSRSFRFTASSLQFTHLLQGSDQRTPDTRSETIPSSRITPDLQIHSFFSSVHLTHLLQGSDQRTPDTRSETIPSSRITPDLQIHSFFSSVHSLIFYGVQIREHLTRDQRPFLHPESLQIFRFTASSLQFTHSSSTGFRSENTWHEIRDHSFIQNHSRSSDSQLLLFSSLTHLLQGSGQRTPDTRSETIPSSRITPDLQIHSFFSSVHSLIFYRVQIREHLTRDQRPFLHPESLQIFRYTASPLQFTSLIFYRVQVRGLDWPKQKLGFVLSDPIFVLFLRFVFGLLYGWKIQTWPIIRFLTESVTYWSFDLLVFDIIHDATCLNKMSRTSSRNIGPQHQKYSSIFHCTHGVLFISVFTKPILSVCCKKANFLVSSDDRSQSHLKFQSCLIAEYAGDCFWMS